MSFRDAKNKNEIQKQNSMYSKSDSIKVTQFEKFIFKKEEE